MRVKSVVVTVSTIAMAMIFPATTAHSTTSDSSCWDYRTTEKSFARKMNLARNAAGIGRLKLDPELSKAARKHTKEMASRDSLYHTPSKVLGRRITRWRMLGENVGVGGTVDSLHQAFMSSPAHEDNILHSAFRHVGIGVRKAGERLWVTVIFESRRDPGTTLHMPSC